MQIPSTHGSRLSRLELQADRGQCGAVKSSFLAAMTGPRILIFVAACFVSLAAPAQEAPVPANEVAGIRAKAEQGDAPAQRTLGHMYGYGRGVPKDYDEAVKWFRKAADQGDALGQSGLGVMYEYGRGVPKNDVEAVKWFRKAAEQGYAAGQTCLGVMYENGRGVPKNDVEAVKWFRKAAEQEFPNAQHRLGVMYESGRGVPKDYVEAVKWFRKAADQGDPAGQDSLGTMYKNGRGIARDDNEAMKWIRKAADQGWSDAQRYLGMLATDKAEKAKWLRKAAEQGDGIAQWFLDHDQGPQQTAKSQARAIQKYPALAVEGSEFNKAFVAEFERRKKGLGRKGIYDKTGLPEDWPMQIAEYVAGLVDGNKQPAMPQAGVTDNSLSIDLVRENGVLKVPVQINGAITLKFVVDSGASDVAIPKDVFLTLIRAETVKDADFRPGKTYVLADGSTVKSDRFILRSLKIGDASVSDIEASVGGLNAQLLLGQSFLSKFKEWRIDNATSKLILTR